MKNRFRIPLLLGLFIIEVILVNKCSAKAAVERDKVLNNNVEFKGYVIDFRASNNHAFGVIRLQLTESSVSVFNDTIKKGIYPYRINGGIAELYTVIPADLDYDDTFNVKSNSHEYDFESKKGHQKYIGELHIIENSSNIDFVKEKTEFK